MRKQLIVAFAILAGLGAAVVRAFSFLREIDINPDTGLYNGLITHPGILTNYILPAVVVLAALVILIAANLIQTPRRAAEPRVGVLWLFAEFAAAAFFAGMGVLEFIDGLSGAYARCVYGVLSVFVAVSIVVIALNAFSGKLEPNPRTGLWATMPVFWSCFAMIMYFWGHAGQPVLSSYIYGTLAVVCAALAMFGTAGFYFRRGKHISTQFFTLMALVLATLTLGGSLLAQLLSSGPLHSSAVPGNPHMLLFGAIIFHMLAIGFGLARGIYDFGVPDNFSKASVPDEEEPDESVDEIVAESFIQKGPETAENEESDDNAKSENVDEIP